MERGTREVWAKRVKQWKESGLTAKQYGAEAGVKPETLVWWKWHLGSLKRDAERRSSTGDGVSRSARPQSSGAQRGRRGMGRDEYVERGRSPGSPEAAMTDDRIPLPVLALGAAGVFALAAALAIG